MKKALLTTFLILATTTWAFGQDKMPTVDQIIDKYVQAVGGKAAVEKQNSRVGKGTLELPSFGASGSLELYAKAPNKTLSVINIEGFGLVQQGFSGTVGWSSDPQSGLRELSGSELAAAKLDAEFYRDIKLKELYPKMELKGKEKIASGDAYVIIATPASGSPDTMYFDAQSGLLVRQDGKRESPQGILNVQVLFEDYKDVDGVKMPFTIKQNSDAVSFIIKLNEVKHNVAIDDAKFNKPAGQ
jgi:outer membrane lipoprotein-sorting protein